MIRQSLAPTAPENLLDDPALASCLGLLLQGSGAYLRGLESILEDDRELAAGFADDILLAIRDGLYHVVITLPFSDSGLAESEMSVRNVTIRPLNPSELAELKFADQTLRPDRKFMRPIDAKRHACTHAMEWSLQLRQDQSLGDFGTEWKQFVLALGILGYPMRCIDYATANALPEWNSFGRAGMPIDPMEIEDLAPVPLTEALVEKALALVPAVGGQVFVEPKTYRDMALRRFALGLAGSDASSGIVDLVTCLEGLLLPGTEPGELSYRFRIHGAWFLSSPERSRSAVLKQLGELYGLRSRLVHRSKSFPSHEERKAQRVVAYGLARTGLLKALTDGWPDEKQFAELVIQKAEAEAPPRPPFIQD